MQLIPQTSFYTTGFDIIKSLLPALWMEGAVAHENVWQTIFQRQNRLQQELTYANGANN